MTIQFQINHSRRRRRKNCIYIFYYILPNFRLHFNGTNIAKSHFLKTFFLSVWKRNPIKTWLYTGTETHQRNNNKYSEFWNWFACFNWIKDDDCDFLFELFCVLVGNRVLNSWYAIRCWMFWMRETGRKEIN